MKFGAHTKFDGYSAAGERTQEKGGLGIIGTVLSVASFFVPALQPIAAAVNFVSSAASGNPLGMITSGFGLANSFGGSAFGDGGFGGSDFGGGSAFGGGDALFYDDWGVGSSIGGDMAGAGFSSAADTVAAGTDFFTEGDNIYGNISGLDPGSMQFDPAGYATGVESSAGDLFTNTNFDIGVGDPGTYGADLSNSGALGSGGYLNTYQDLNAASQTGTLPQLGEAPSLDTTGFGYDMGPYQSTGVGDTSGYSAGDSLDAGGGSLGNEYSYYPSQGGEMGPPEPGFMDKISNKVGNMKMGDWLKVGKGLYGMYNEQNQLKELKKMGERAASMADPFAPQRPQYQSLLSQSYTPQGLQSLFNTEYMGGQGNQLMQQLQARDAASGRRSQYGARLAQLQSDFMNNYIPRYRQGLGNPSGANFGPGNASTAYISGMRPAIMNQGAGLAGLMGGLSDIFR